MLTKTLGRRARARPPGSPPSPRSSPATSCGRRCRGRWLLSSRRAALTMVPAIVYWIAGLALAHGAAPISIGTAVAFTSMLNRLVGADDRAAEHRRAGVDVDRAVRADLRGARPAGRRRRAAGRAAARRGARRSAPGRRVVPLRRRRTVDAARHRPASSRRARRRRSSARPAPARPPWPTSLARLYDADAGAVRIDGHDVRELTLDSVSDAIGLVAQDTYLFHDTVGANLRFAAPGRDRRRARRCGRGPRASTAWSRACRTDTTPSSARAVTGSPAASGSGWRSRGCCCATRAILILDEATSALDTETERAVQAALDELAAGGRRSPSRTGCRPCAAPTRSSCSTRAGSSSAARTRSCWRAVGATRGWPATDQ